MCRATCLPTEARARSGGSYAYAGIRYQVQCDLPSVGGLNPIFIFSGLAGVLCGTRQVLKPPSALSVLEMLFLGPFSGPLLLRSVVISTEKREREKVPADFLFGNFS